MEPVPVVVVHRDQPARCAETVAAFRAQTVPVAITVVDNGSGTTARERLARLPDVRVIELGANTGFGPAANVALREWLRAGQEWAVLAPHDAIPEPTCVERVLVEAAARPAAGLACAEFGTAGIPVVDGYLGGMLLPVDRGPDGWVPVGFPHGTLMALRRRCVLEVGLFDERFFAYCEEADLGERARRAGWKVGMVRGAVVRNPHVAAPAPVVEYLQLRNSLLLVRKHFGRYHCLVRCAAAAVDTAWRELRPSRRTPIYDRRARLLAVRDFLEGRFGPPPPTLERRRPEPQPIVVRTGGANQPAQLANALWKRSSTSARWRARARRPNGSPRTSAAARGASENHDRIAP